MIQVRFPTGSSLYYVKGVLLRMKRKISLLSLLLVAALVLGMVPFGAFRTEAYAATADGDGTAATSFDVKGSKTASPTELDPENRETTVTLQLPAGEYQNAVDIVFVMDNSTSTKNSGIDFSQYVKNLLDSIVENNTGVDLKVSIVKFRGYATDMLNYITEGTMSGLTKYDSDSSSTIQAAVANNSVPGSGSNGHSGLVMAEQVLSADDSVDNDHKYVVFLTDGKNYIWNNADNEPVTIYQQAAKSGAIQNSGKPRLNQYDGITQKENGAYPSIYNSIPQITSHQTLIFSEGLNINLYDSAYYTNLYNSTHADLTGPTKYDFPAYYSKFYPVDSYTGTLASGDGSVVPHSISNATTDILPNQTPAFYKTYYEYIPQEGTFWENVNYLQTNPYKVVLNSEDGKYYYDTDQVNEDFFLWHATSMEKGTYTLGHYWKETIDAKYNTGVIVFYDTGSGTGSHITQSFDQWLVENSDYGAWISNAEQVNALFEGIDNSIRYMVSEGVVTDKITGDFTLKNADNADGFRMTWNKEALAVAYASGKWNFGEIGNDGKYPYVVSYDESKKTITWEINVPVENLKPVTLSYDLIIDEDAENGEYDTNVSAVLEYKSSDGKRDGTYTFEKPVVTYNATAPYVVRYLEDGTEIPVAEEKKGDPTTIGSFVSEAAITVKGYILKAGEPESKQLKITTVAADNVITFLYTALKSNYKINHIDEDTEEILLTQNGEEVQVGKYVSGSAVQFRGYELSPNQPETQEIEIVENEEENVIEFFYKALMFPVTINHWLEGYTAPASGNAAGSSSSSMAGLAVAATTADASKYGLYKTETATGKLDAEYTADKLNPIPSGYHFDQAVTNDLGQEKGVITEKGLELNLYYSKDQAPTPRPNPNPKPNPEPDPTDEPEPIDDPDTPLAPSETEDTEIDDGDTPLAPAETEDTEIDEEATPLSPFTGDSRHTAVWAGISVAALLGIIFLSKKRKING